MPKLGARLRGDLNPYKSPKYCQKPVQIISKVSLRSYEISKVHWKQCLGQCCTSARLTADVLSRTGPVTATKIKIESRSFQELHSFLHHWITAHIR